MEQTFDLPQYVYDAFKAHGIRVVEVAQPGPYPDRWRTTLECWSSLVGTFRLYVSHEPDMRDFSVQLAKEAHEIDTDQKADDLFNYYRNINDRKSMADLLDAAEAVQHRFIQASEKVTRASLTAA